jgi:tripartite-type tricarboxylate transporter receptor subunit TctC
MKYFLTLMLLVTNSVLAAEIYPSKPIVISIATAPGSAPDSVIRIVAQKMTEVWHQPVIIDNRPGAGGISSVTQVTKNPADGYTLLVHTAAFTIAPSMYKLPYDTFRDLTPISVLAYVPNVLVIHPSLPVKNINELIVLAKARPGELFYSSSGSGTPAHLAGELLKTMASVNLTHVPFKSSPQALISVMSGETTMLFSPLSIAVPYINTNRLRALGVTTAKRSKLMPEIPTIAEKGLRGYEVTQWYGMQAPSGTPKDTITKLNLEIKRVLSLPEVIEKFSLLGAEPVYSSPESMASYVKTEVEKWARVVKLSGAKVD